jgi:hypothetical protein
MTSCHLTHEQLCDLILTSSHQLPESENPSTEAAHDHLRNCLLCASELQNLRASISLFRHATLSYAKQQYTRPTVNKASIAPLPGVRSHLLYWATAAAVSVAVILPLSLHRQSAPRPATAIVSQQTTESDEALLEGIAQDLSTDVPSAMQPLADPTAGSTATAQPSSDQRKN